MKTTPHLVYIFLRQPNGKLELAGTVIASTAQDAFEKTQNDFTENGWNSVTPCRSTMVGDVFTVMQEGVDINMEVTGNGFRITDNPSIHQIK